MQQEYKTGDCVRCKMCERFWEMSCKKPCFGAMLAGYKMCLRGRSQDETAALLFMERERATTTSEIRFATVYISVVYTLHITAENFQVI